MLRTAFNLLQFNRSYLIKINGLSTSNFNNYSSYENMGDLGENNTNYSESIYQTKSERKKPNGSRLEASPKASSESDFKPMKTRKMENSVGKQSIKSCLAENLKGVKRLRFKKTQHKGSRKVNYALNKKVIPEEMPEPRQSGSTFETKKNLNENMSAKRPIRVYEYGSDVNGYKFLAFNEEEIPDFKKCCEEKDTSGDSSDISSSENEEFAFQPSQQTPKSTDAYNYNIYWASWKRIESGCAVDNNLVLPVRTNSMNDMTKASVLEFLQKKDVIKRERVRWHPDRMKTILSRCQMWNSATERDVTQVFQVVNDTYESV